MGTWYWTDAAQGDSGYTSSEDYIPTTYINACPVVITVGGSVTQAAIKISTYGGTPSTAAVQLYDSSKNKIVGKTASITINGTGWKAGNMDSNYTAGNSETVYFAFICDAQNGTKFGRDASGNGTYKSGQTYPTFPASIADFSVDGIDYGFKLNVETTDTSLTVKMIS